MKAGCWFILLMAVLVPLLPAQGRTGTPVPGFPAQPPSLAYPVSAPSTTFGVIGIGGGQKMRVVATNVGIAPPLATAVAIPACGVDVKILDSNGQPVSGSSGSTDSLASEKSFSVEVGPVAGRADYQAQVQIKIPAPATNTGGILSRLMVCNIVTTVQVYDSVSQKTDFVVTGNPIVMGYIPLQPCLTGQVCVAAADSAATGDISGGTNRDSSTQP